MKYLIAPILIISIIALIGTLLLTRENDENYSGSTKKNITNLTSIYVVVILLCLIILGVYICFLF